MKILLLGATGRTGKHILSEALKRGFTVNALVRDTRKVAIEHSALRIFEGNAADRANLAAALLGCEAVISALNISRTSDFPWAPLRTPENFLEQVLSNLISLMEEAQIKRLVLTSAWGVGDSREEIPGWFRWFIDNSNIGKAYSQHAVQEALLKESRLDWTAVRPVGLTNGKKLKSLIVSQGGVPKPNLLISRKLTAHFMLDCLEKKTYIASFPVISQA